MFWPIHGVASIRYFSEALVRENYSVCLHLFLPPYAVSKPFEYCKFFLAMVGVEPGLLALQANALSIIPSPFIKIQNHVMLN